jgi:hypothetical protein
MPATEIASAAATPAPRRTAVEARSAFFETDVRSTFFLLRMIQSENRLHPTSHYMLRRTAHKTRRSLGEGGFSGSCAGEQPVM